MMQKDALEQDMFLLGPPGPMRRHLALQYAELAGRECEVLSISRDTTESDLKQRREIVGGGEAVFVDQPPVRAAVEGRLLLLEGIEKAERNVLPTLNNLLEVRAPRCRKRRSCKAPCRTHTPLLRGHWSWALRTCR